MLGCDMNSYQKIAAGAWRCLQMVGNLRHHDIIANCKITVMVQMMIRSRRSITSGSSHGIMPLREDNKKEQPQCLETSAYTKLTGRCQLAIY